MLVDFLLIIVRWSFIGIISFGLSALITIPIIQHLEFSNLIGWVTLLGATLGLIYPVNRFLVLSNYL